MNLFSFVVGVLVGAGALALTCAVALALWGGVARAQAGKARR